MDSFKDFKHPWRALFLILIGVMTFLIGALWWQYSQLCEQTHKFKQMHDQYYEYVTIMKRIIDKQMPVPVDVDELSEQETIGNDEIEEDAFLVINRTPQHLQSSTLDYLRDQELESMLGSMDIQELQPYADQVILPAKSGAVIKSTYPSASTKNTTKPKNIKNQNVQHTSVTGLKFSWPIAKDKFWLSSFFGKRKKNGKWGFHYGIDMAAQRGTPITAAAAGTVEYAGYSSGYGNTILVVHDKVYKTRYAHLNVINTHKGARVSAGQKIGSVGDTGFTIKLGKDASHLHFELFEKGKQINPLYLLPRM